VKLAGEAYVSVVDGYEMADDGAGSYRGNTGARIERVSRVELQDFKEQVEGEIHFMVKSDIIRARMFYADFSGKRLSKEYQLNHFVKVIPPNEAELKAFSINTLELRETLRSLPLANQRPTDGYFEYVAEVEDGERYKQYVTAKLGVERGICLLLGYDDSAVAPVVDPDDGSAGGTVGSGSALAQAPTSDSDAMPSLAQAAGGTDQPALAAAPDANVAGDDVAGIVFDGGQLASINIFAEVPREPFGIDIVALASAAIPIIETALEGRVERPVEETPPAGQGGLLEEQATRVSLNSIALGLGAPAVEAGAMVENIIQVATQGSEYPIPPKPEKAGKDQEMEDVMSNLESLIGGRA
ncbi:TPA: IcmO-like type IV secretion system protein, partial [Pseudomonas aeruginosa]